MPVVNAAQYRSMLQRAKEGRFAYPAFNVTSTETVNAVLLGLKEAQSDGIIQISTGGAEFWSGQGVKSMARGATAMADYARFIAAEYDVNVALHTDHCHPKHLEGFVLPLIAETEARRAKGLPNLFNAHMFDGSELPLDENIRVSTDLLKRCAASEIVLEVETGIVGGEEDGHDARCPGAVDPRGGAHGRQRSCRARCARTGRSARRAQARGAREGNGLRPAAIPPRGTPGVRAPADCLPGRA